MRMGDEGAQVRCEAVPTGALSLDLALGIGGVPRGRIVEIFGPESSGKTTLIYHVLAEAQKLGGVCAFIDAEHSMDPLYAKEIGVDIDELLVSQPDYGEQALEIADMLVHSGAVDVVAIDSVAALTPRVELEGQMGDQTVGSQARMMSQAMRKLAGNLNRTQTLCLLTNQIREKVGVKFGSPETQPGVRALKFYASQRLDVRRIETLKDGTEAVGNRVRVKKEGFLPMRHQRIISAAPAVQKAERAILRQLLREDHAECWARTDLEEALTHIPLVDLVAGLDRLRQHGISQRCNGLVWATRSAHYLDSLGVISI
ncbi:MAG TPA: recombinase RecA [Solirubrobacteraceae bacterium]|jgi:recombination protein RecA|nr:recombinase RecA [Solirubrobacteraceae bacterium]